MAITIDNDVPRLGEIDGRQRIGPSLEPFLDLIKRSLAGLALLYGGLFAVVIMLKMAGQQEGEESDEKDSNRFIR